MLTRLVVSAFACAFIAGCGQKESPGDAGTNAASPMTAPVDYLDAIHKGQQQAVKTIDTAAVTQAIQLFHVERGRYPRDLNELVTEKFLSRVPEAPAGMRLSYNPQTGEFRVARQ